MYSFMFKCHSQNVTKKSWHIFFPVSIIHENKPLTDFIDIFNFIIKSIFLDYFYTIFKIIIYIINVYKNFIISCIILFFIK